jgi:benzodiazapine receptor
MNDKTQQFQVVAGTLLTLVFNWLASTGILGGISTGAVSDKYETLITPAGIAFSIWGLIYFGLVLFTLVQAKAANRETLRPIRLLYLGTCVANSLWLYLWSLEMMVACLLVIVLLLIMLAAINIRLQKVESKALYWLVAAPFGIYFGWVTAATILNATIAFVSFEVTFGAKTDSLLGALLLVVAGVIAITVRFSMKNYFFPLAIAWAALMIGIGNSANLTVTIGATIAVVFSLISAGLFVIDMKGSADMDVNA